MFPLGVPLSYWCFVLLLLVVISPVRGQAQETEPFNICLAQAADGTCVYPTQRFLSPTRQVVVAFGMPKGGLPQLKVELIVLDVAGAIPPNSVIARQETQPAEGVARVVRTFAGPPLPNGRYRVDVTSGGKLWKSAEFVIVAAEKAPDVRRPEDLMPLVKGKVWTYALVRETRKASLPPGPVAGIGPKVALPGAEPGMKSNASVTLTAAGSDQAGTRIEMRRDGMLVGEEWWRVDDRGWSVTQRKGPLGPVAVDPPEILLPLPLAATREWTYEPKRRGFQQKSGMWGPYRMKGPRGDAPGYVILIEQRSRSATESVERHFLLGVGVVREISITAVGTEMASRTELTLQEGR